MESWVVVMHDVQFYTCFKIDVIVWKVVRRYSRCVGGLRFKIDVIVWKEKWL